MQGWSGAAFSILAVLLPLAVLAGPTGVQDQVITEFPLPPGSAPAGIATGFGAVWFTENGQDKIGRLAFGSGEVVEFTLPAGPPLHAGLMTDADGVWYTRELASPTSPMGGERIGRLDPQTGEATEFPLNPNSRPARITTGFGFVWYTDINRNVIGRLDPGSGSVAEFGIPTANSTPVGITTGFGAVWFAEIEGQQIGRLDPNTGNITEFGPTGVQPFGVATGFGGVWFTTRLGNTVGMLDPGTGSLVEKDVPTPDSSPVEITIGNGAVWFTEIFGDKIARVDPSTWNITEFDLASGSKPFGIASGYGSIWFAQVDGDRIGVLDTRDPAAPLELGSILPFTGNLSAFGLPMRDAVNMAADEVSRVGVLGRSLEFLHRDSQTDPTAAAAAATELVSLGVPVIIGAAGSPVSWPVANVTVPNEVVQISPSSTSPLFTTFESFEPGWFWRTAASDALQGQVAAMRAVERGWATVGILVMDHPLWLGVTDAFRENFTGSVPVQVIYARGQSNFLPDLQLIADFAPDAVFFVGEPEDGLAMMQHWWDNRGPPAWNWSWLFWELLRDADFVQNLKNAGINATGVEGVAAVLEGPQYSAFRAEFLARYGREPQTFAAHAYDSVYLSALAAVAAQATDSLSIRDHLRGVASPPGTVVGPGVEDFARAVCALEAGGSVNYEGASGRVNFDAVGDVGSPFVIWRIDENYTIVEANRTPESALWPPSSRIPTDTTSPILSILSPSPGESLATSEVTASWSASDDGSGLDYFVVSLDGAPVCLPPSASSHTFSSVQEGSHTVVIMAYDLEGNRQMASVVAAVDTTLPIADAGGDKTVDVGEPVSFNATGSSDNMGIVSFEWDFGDGSGGTGETLTHAYADAGAYTVVLTVRDAAGNADTDVSTVVVQAPSVRAPVITAAVVSVEIVVIIMVVLVYGRPGRGSR